jgi:serine/threonine protein kinase
MVVGAAGPASDETPTVISKGLPAQAIMPAPPGEVLNGSLRGRRLAHFELIEAIGVGGMAAVLRARDTQLDRIVALKILPPEMANEENIRRFHQEARAAARLDHENIAQVFFCGEDQRLHFIAFEFVEGDNLRALLQRHSRLPIAEAIHYMVQIAAGLDHAASRGVVHRDIKPSNIIITPTGRAKLVDMGLARHLGGPAEGALTHSGVTLGTFDYISPEQALEPRDADVRSDIYSLGCTFYHMLTGYPPVPEGTAAKKLHHHQHVPPLDPRVLNPEVPDAVAAILARMMAKDPKDRYQRPEHLVAHLLQVGHQLGVAPEVPEGVLAVDAPLPTPPQKRLGLLAILAVGGLAAILFLLSMLPSEPTGKAFIPGPRDGSGRTHPEEVLAGPSQPGDASKDPAGIPPVVTSEKALQAALARIPSKIRLKGQIALGKSLTIRAPEDGSLLVEAEREPALIRVGADLAASASASLTAGLVVEAGPVTFKNLVFLLEVEYTPESLLAAVAVITARQVTFEGCAFVQIAPQEALIRKSWLVPAASLALSGSGASKTQVVLKNCFFSHGQAAVAVRGWGDVRADSCAFGPHGALFHLRGRGKASQVGVTLKDCSAFVVNGPAFRLDEGGVYNISSQNCVFSCPTTAPRKREKSDDPHLLRLTGKGVQVHYADALTCYHNLYALWAGTGDDLVVDWSVFRERVRSLSGTEPTSWLATGPLSPWDLAEPLKALLLDNPMGVGNLDAFRVNPRAPEFRQGTSGVAALRPLGVQKCVFGDYTDPPLRELPRTILAGPGQKIVDPSAKTGGGVYRSLLGALAEARAGDVVLIKHTGYLPVDPVHLKVDQDITIKPYEDHRPILILARDTKEFEAALFRIAHAKLRLESLAFELAPTLAEYRSQAVVVLQGSGQCSFKDCLFTLKAAHGVALCVAAFEGSDAKTMPMPDRQPPRLSFSGPCFVRGEGDLVRVPQSRPFELKMENTAVALDGSLLTVGESKLETLPAAALARVDLRRVTTYLTGHLVLLEDNLHAGKGLVKTSVTAQDCLFLPAREKALVQLDGLNYKAERERVFAWQGKHNAYGAFDKVLDHTPRMNVPSPYLDSTDWGMAFNETEKDSESRFVRVRIDSDVPRDALFSRLSPLQLRVRSELVDGYGVALDQIAETLGLNPPTVEDGSPAADKK